MTTDRDPVTGHADTIRRPRSWCGLSGEDCAMGPENRCDVHALIWDRDVLLAERQRWETLALSQAKEIDELAAERQQAQSDLALCQQARQQLFEQRRQAIDALRRIADEKHGDCAMNFKDAIRIARAALVKLGEKP